MKTIVIGTYLSPDLIAKYNDVSKSNSKISNASIKYSDLISRGFKENLGDDAQALFMPPIGSFPHCRKLFWNTGIYHGKRYVKFINIILLKQITIVLYTFFYLVKWVIHNRKEEKVIVLTYLYLPFMISVIPFKIFTGTKVVSFVPDLPNYEFTYSENDGWLKKVLIPIYIFFANKLLSVVDFFVFITRHMTEIFPKKPFHIMEGLVDLKPEPEPAVIPHKKAIMYSGALYERFGIGILIDAFMKIKGDYELWLCGNGDMVNRIEKLSEKDPRIKFFGILPNDEVLECQRNALLLVNPRFSSADFTKYSFPSKLMEYLNSGTPVLTTKLPGIPEDYSGIFFFIENENEQGMIEAIYTVLKKDYQELIDFGQQGKHFVLAEKNYKKQIHYVLESISSQLNIST